MESGKKSNPSRHKSNRQKRRLRAAEAFPIAVTPNLPCRRKICEMPRKRKLLNTDLATLYTKFLDRQTKELRERCAAVNRERERKLDRLRKRGVVTVADLLAQLSRLPSHLRQFGIEFVILLKIHQAIPVLLNLIFDPTLRLGCADALGWLKSSKRVTQFFLSVGRRELAAATPDRRWLEAVILGLGSTHDQTAAELLVTIFERIDLPGWLRGDAADKLGLNRFIRDRRTRLFRRCHAAAIRGFDDESIDVQFWSMYLVGSLCSNGLSRRHAQLDDFKSALPRLRDFAATDHRLAPGYWWPLSAEAEDVIVCIKAGHWPTPDAADRWISNTKRGEWNRSY